MEVFRQALRRRGAPELPLYRSGLRPPLSCAECFAAAAEELGYRLEEQAPLPGEEQIFAPYEYLGWYSAPSGEGPTELRLSDPVRYGLLRLVPASGRPEEEVWLWSHEAGSLPSPDDEVCLAAPGREVLGQLVRAAQTHHAAHDRSRAGMILLGNTRETRTESSGVRWEDVLLPPGMQDDLSQTVEEFFASGDLYRRHGLAHRRGILLAGPPGNGKTSVLKAIAHAVPHPTVVAVLDDPNSGLYNCRHAFERASELAPAVLCFEDLDTLVDDGPLLSQFLNLLDGMERLDGVLVIATTNRPDRIDPAISKRPSRFDRVFLVPEPDEELRGRYLTHQLGEDAPGDLAWLASETEGYSVAFLKELLLQARLAAVRASRDGLLEEDLRAALATTREHLRLASAGLQDRGSVGFA